jgi:hypothetical protein
MIGKGAYESRSVTGLDISQDRQKAAWAEPDFQWEPGSLDRWPCPRIGDDGVCWVDSQRDAVTVRMPHRSVRLSVRTMDARFYDSAGGPQAALLADHQPTAGHRRHFLTVRLFGQQRIPISHPLLPVHSFQLPLPVHHLLSGHGV